VTSPATRVCPQCGATIDADRNFVIWRERCNWNVDAGAKPDAVRRSKKRQERARLKGQRLVSGFELVAQILSERLAV